MSKWLSWEELHCKVVHKGWLSCLSWHSGLWLCLREVRLDRTKGNEGFWLPVWHSGSWALARMGLFHVAPVDQTHTVIARLIDEQGTKGLSWFLKNYFFP